MSDQPGLAAYQRVVEAVKKDIRSGALEVGARLPGHRKLAEQHGVALGTAQKAVQILETEGWVVSQPAVGVFVQEPPAEDRSPVTIETVIRQLDQLQAAVLHLTERVEHLEAADDARSVPPSQ
ncbi:GntR family transcriptional regulator [Lentzea chajnantorensis]